jgi:hypothetical protein
VEHIALRLAQNLLGSMLLLLSETPKSRSMSRHRSVRHGAANSDDKLDLPRNFVRRYRSGLRAQSLSCSLTAGADVLDATKVDATNKASEAFVALVKDSADTRRAPRLSDPGVKTLIKNDGAAPRAHFPRSARNFTA